MYEYKAIPVDKYPSDQLKDKVLEDQRNRLKQSLYTSVIMIIIFIIYYMLNIFISGGEQIGFLTGVFTLVIWFLLIQYRRIKLYK